MAHIMGFSDYRKEGDDAFPLVIRIPDSLWSHGQWIESMVELALPGRRFAFRTANAHIVYPIPGLGTVLLPGHFLRGNPLYIPKMWDLAEYAVFRYLLANWSITSEVRRALHEEIPNHYSKEQIERVVDEVPRHERNVRLV